MKGLSFSDNLVLAIANCKPDVSPVQAIDPDMPTKTLTRRIPGKGNSVFGSAPRAYWDHANFENAWPDGTPEGGMYLHVPCHANNEGPCAHCAEMGWAGTVHRLYPRLEVGETVYVKEALKRGGEGSRYFLASYRADNTPIFGETWRWKRSVLPAMFMPADCARYFITFTDIRVQRVQDITEEEAIAEGSRSPYPGCQAAWTERHAFKNIWNSIHGKGAWERNDWCWILGFVRTVKP